MIGKILGFIGYFAACEFIGSAIVAVVFAINKTIIDNGKTEDQAFKRTAAIIGTIIFVAYLIFGEMF